MCTRACYSIRIRALVGDSQFSLGTIESAQSELDRSGRVESFGMAGGGIAGVQSFRGNRPAAIMSLPSTETCPRSGAPARHRWAYRRQSGAAAVGPVFGSDRRTECAGALCRGRARIGGRGHSGERGDPNRRRAGWPGAGYVHGGRPAKPAVAYGCGEVKYRTTISRLGCDIM